MEESGIKGSAYCHTDWRGVITSCSVHLQDEKYNYLQGLELSHQGDKALARLESRRKDGTHEITVPIEADGSLRLEEGQETLKLHTPWLSPGSTQYVPSTGITSLEDPRLERLAAAAEQGFHLAPGDLGPGWKCETSGNRQVWSVANEEVVVDAKEHTVQLSAHGWGTGHAGSSDSSCDYDIDSSVKWQDGRMTQV